MSGWVSGLIDSVVEAVSPTRAVQRKFARETMAATVPLKGADTHGRNVRTFRPRMLSRDAENEEGGVPLVGGRRQFMGVRAGWLVRNNPLARGAVDSIRDNAVGTGLQLQSIPDTEALGWTKEEGLSFSKDVERRFSAWAASEMSDIREQSSFYEQQEIALVTTWVKGDMFFALPVRKRKAPTGMELAVDMIEPERVATPTGVRDAIAGVVKNEVTGAAEFVYVAKRHPGDTAIGKLEYRKEAVRGKNGQRRIFHVMFRENIEQTRGDTRFQAVLDLFNDLGKYSESELTAAIISAYFTVFAKTKGGTTLAPLAFEDPDGTQGSRDSKEMQLGPGAVVATDEDVDFTIANPNRPNSQFDPFVAAVLKQIAVGLGLPMEVLLKHFTSSYSAARAEMQEAWRTYRRSRTLTARHFCQPIFERWMDLEVTAGRIKAPGYFKDHMKRAAYLRTAWTGDQPGSLDPLKDAKARGEDLKNGVRTLDEAAIEATGVGYWEKHDAQVQIAAERRAGGLTTPGEAAPVATPSAPSNPQDPAESEIDDSGDLPEND